MISANKHVNFSKCSICYMYINESHEKPKLRFSTQMCCGLFCLLEIFSPPPSTLTMSLPKSSNTPIEKALETLTISRQHHLQHLKTLRLSPSGKIVILNGLPGTGKLTILKRLKELLPEFTTCL